MDIVETVENMWAAKHIRALPYIIHYWYCFIHAH